MLRLLISLLFMFILSSDDILRQQPKAGRDRRARRSY
jgi:hypothetical protein